MNNCPKCGNPLQVGTESCPICGTNTSSAAPAVAPTPVSAPVVEPAPAVAPTPAPAPVVEPTPEVAPTPAPEIKAIEPTTPVPSIIAPEEEKTTKSEVPTAKPVTPEKNKKGNKTIVIVLLLLAIVAGGIFLINGNFGGGKGQNLKPQPQNSIASAQAASNGFKFNLAEGWIIQEDGSNVIITNSDETVVLKLEKINSNFSKINKSTIESYYSSKSEFTNTKVEEVKISVKDAYLVNTNSGELPVQIYYINGGTSLTLGATIVYQSKESKEKYVAEVTELIGTMSYSDESIKAISTIEMYSSIFKNYQGVFEYEAPVDNVQNPENNPSVENQSTENLEKPSTPSEENQSSQNTETPSSTDVENQNSSNDNQTSNQTDNNTSNQDEVNQSPSEE